MLVKSDLIFLDVVEHEYIKEGDKKKILYGVFYDKSSYELVKPFLDESHAKQLKLLSFGSYVVCELEIYQGRRGIGSRLLKCETQKDVK